MPYLADTNVVREISKPVPDRQFVRWLIGVPQLYVSAITREEMAFGFARKPSLRMQGIVDQFISRQAVILPVTDAIAILAGQMRGRLETQGHVREPVDMIIAATAEIHGLTIATRNVRHFEGLGLAIVNPFS